MKKSLFSNIFKFALFFVAAAVIVTSCKKDDDDNGGGGDIVLDGFYVHGDATASVDLASNMIMKTTKNEVGQADRATLYEKYIALTANSDFHITQVAGSTQTTWGPGTDFAEVANPTGDEPKNAPFWRGSLVETSDAFQVPEDGLYHVVFDSEFNKVVVARVKWGVIGAATPGGWTDDTELAEGAFNLESMSFSTTDVEMKLNEFKYRYSGGWKIEIDTTDANPDNWVKVNTNYGGAVDALEAGGSNISVTDPGIYTLTVNWTLANGVNASREKTGDLDFTDWSDVVFDVFGNGVDPANATAVADPSTWGWGYAVSADGAPTVEGDVASGAVFTYTWTNVSMLNADGEGFGFRSYDGTDYNGTVLRYGALDTVLSNMDIVGMTVNGFGDENINVLSDVAVDITLTIDAGNNDEASIVIVENGAASFDQWGLIGDATPNAWDSDTEMTPNADGTEWTWTGDLVEGQFKFRMNSSWDNQIGDDGAGGAEFSNNATAWVIGATGVGAAGNYTIVLDSETPAVTLTQN